MLSDFELYIIVGAIFLSTLLQILFNSLICVYLFNFIHKENKKR